METVRADSIGKSLNLSVLTRPKYSSVDNSVVKFNAWLINMLLFDYLRCMLTLIIALSQSLNEYLSSLPLLQRLRLQRGCKLLSAMGSPPALILRDFSRCEFIGGNVKCLNTSITETPCCASGRCRKQ